MAGSSKRKRIGHAKEQNKKQMVQSEEKQADPNDKNRFVSEAVENQFQFLEDLKSFIEERGIDFTNNNQPKFLLVYIEMFIDNAASCSPLSVKEFYANLPEAKNDKCYVRGKWVTFSCTAINVVYDVDDIDDDEHSILRASKLSYAKEFDVLTRGHQRTWTSEGDGTKSISTDK